MLSSSVHVSDPQKVNINLISSLQILLTKESPGEATFVKVNF